MSFPQALIMTIAALFALAALQTRPSYDDWNSWSTFPEGAWVKTERDSRGEFESAFIQTLTKKEANRLMVKTSTEKKDDKGADNPPAVVIESPFGKGDERIYEKNPKPVLCPTSRADHKASIVTDRKKEKLKIGEKEVLCAVMDVVTFDCKAMESGKSRWWLSKEVPGGLVKREWTASDKPGKVVDTVVDFDKKKMPYDPGK